MFSGCTSPHYSFRLTISNRVTKFERVCFFLQNETETNKKNEAANTIRHPQEQTLGKSVYCPLFPCSLNDGSARAPLVNFRKLYEMFQIFCWHNSETHVVVWTNDTNILRLTTLTFSFGLGFFNSQKHNLLSPLLQSCQGSFIGMLYEVSRVARGKSVLYLSVIVRSQQWPLRGRTWTWQPQQ